MNSGLSNIESLKNLNKEMGQPTLSPIGHDALGMQQTIQQTQFEIPYQQQIQLAGIQFNPIPSTHQQLEIQRQHIQNQHFLRMLQFVQQHHNHHQRLHTSPQQQLQLQLHPHTLAQPHQQQSQPQHQQQNQPQRQPDQQRLLIQHHQQQEHHQPAHLPPQRQQQQPHQKNQNHQPHQQSQQSPQQNHKQQQKQKKSPLLDIIGCKLCKSYLIDAVTLTCSHSFCKSCLLKKIRENPKCPECNMEIKKGYLNKLKIDHVLQNMIYKLVPQLYENEMSRRRKYYAAKPTTTLRFKSEMFGDVPEYRLIKPEDFITLNIRSCQGEINFACKVKANIPIRVLRKLITTNFNIIKPIRFYYDDLRDTRCLSNTLYSFETIREVAIQYLWKPENKIMNLLFDEVTENSDFSSSSPTNSDPVP